MSRLKALATFGFVALLVSFSGSSAARGEVPCEVALLSPSDNADPLLSGFGNGVAIHGDRVVVAAPHHDGGIPGSVRGAVYVFRQEGLNWIAEAMLVGSNVGNWDAFGGGLDLYANRFIAGAVHFDPASFDPGEAYVFRRDPEGWVEEAYLTASDGFDGDAFGLSVHIDDDLAVIGAPTRGWDIGPGKVYVFSRTGVNWSEDHVLMASDGTTNDLFGWSLDKDGDLIAVGATQPFTSSTGTVYLFSLDGVNWNEVEKLTPSDGAIGDQFGEGVALEGDWLLVAAPMNDEAGFRAGAVYVYKNIAGTWQQVDKLLSPDPQDEGRFGSGIEMEGEWAVFDEWSAGGPHVFQRVGDAWKPRYRLEGYGGLALEFPYALSGETVNVIAAIPPCIPAVGVWGLLCLVLLLTVAASVRLRGRSVCVSCLMFMVCGDAALAQASDLDFPHHPEHLFVRFAADVDTQERASIESDSGAVEVRCDRFVHNMCLVTVPPEDIATVLTDFRDHPRVLYSEPDYVIVPNVEPNDEFWSQQWNMDMTNGIRAPAAWDIWTGEQAPELLVAVIDNGVAYTHPDLAQNIWTNPNESAGDANGDGCPGICGVDDDGDGWIDECPSPPLPLGASCEDDDDENGYVDDVHGYDFTSPDYDSDPFPEPSIGKPGHGTHIAGILAAVGNNSVGVAGTVWRAKTVVLKFYNASGLTSDAIEAIEYCIDNNIRISNNSWRVVHYSQALYNKIQASQAVGHIFVTSANNDGTDIDVNPQYPAAYDLPNIITVANTKSNDMLSSDSNYGRISVDLGAPGFQVYSTYWVDTPPPDGTNTYWLLSGTSMAAPHVAGAVALVWGRSPGLTWQKVKNRVLKKVRPVIGLQGRTVTGGILDLPGALNDCNVNGIDDAIDLGLGGGSSDCDGDKVPDECEWDCDENGVPDDCELPIGACCLSRTSCIDALTECVCEHPSGFNGTFAGQGSTCAGNPCFALVYGPQP